MEPGFQEVNRLFVLSFENRDERKTHTGYFLVMIDLQNFCNQPIKKIK